MDKIRVNFLFVAMLAGVCGGFECPQLSPPTKPCESIKPGECQKDSDCGHEYSHQYRCCIHPCLGGKCYKLKTLWGCPSWRADILCIAQEIFPRRCHKDVDCDKNAKCCPQGCHGPDCVESTPKPGVCSNARGKPSGINTEDITKRSVCHHALECGVDGDCPGDQKCCQTGCGGSRCEEPEPEPPKVCFRNKETGRDCVCEKKRTCKFSRSLEICKKRNRKCEEKGHICCCGMLDWSKKKCERKQSKKD